MTNTRRPRLGRPWRRTITHVIRRDPDCRLAYPNICTGTSQTADHLVPRAHGGSDDPTNLQGACHPCNRHRSDNDLPATNTNRQTRQW